VEVGMSFIRMLAEDEAAGELAQLYTSARDPEHGRVDNIMRIHSLHPAGLAAHLALYTAVMRGTATLPKLERELIALVVSKLNACHY
jgi:alkylhydroperoxidase family enzyme